MNDMAGRIRGAVMRDPVEFGAAVANVVEMSTGWQRGLIASESGTPKPLLANALHALREAPAWQGVLARDEFALCTVARRSTLWAFTGAWTEQQDALTAEWLQRQRIAVSVDTAARAVETVAAEHSFDPLCEKLGSLKWDGIQRLDRWMHDYLGAEDSHYVRNIGSRTLISAIARAKRPGCKVDSVLVLEGAQGAGKSSAWRILAYDWFSDDMAELGTKDSAMQTAAAWVIELPELDALSRTEQSRIKSFISRSTDRFRPPYGRRILEAPRRSIFVGTVNHASYLRDETGGRRFWPVRCGAIDLAALERDRDQLWAEAVHRFNAGESWWITDAETAVQAAAEQADRYEADPWQSLITEWAESTETISVREIFFQVLKKPEGQWTQADQNRIARCLRVTGWERYQKRVGVAREWRYRRQNDE